MRSHGGLYCLYAKSSSSIAHFSIHQLVFGNRIVIRFVIRILISLSQVHVILCMPNLRSRHFTIDHSFAVGLLYVYSLKLACYTNSSVFISSSHTYSQSFIVAFNCSD